MAETKSSLIDTKPHVAGNNRNTNKQKGRFSDMARLVLIIILLAIGIAGAVAATQNMATNNERFSQEKMAIAQELDVSLTKLLDLCYDTDNIPALQLCKTDYHTIKTDCKEFPSMNICSDPRLAMPSMLEAKITKSQERVDEILDEILDEKAVLEARLQQSDAALPDAAGLYLDACVDARTVTDITDCKAFRVQVLEICQNAPDLDICSDPRLDKIRDLQPSS
jgi:hypothetical protein